MVNQWDTNWFTCFTIILLLQCGNIPAEELTRIAFTSQLYNATIFQDASFGEFATPLQPHMGVTLLGSAPNGTVKFYITSNDFRPEVFHLGDFYFLRIKVTFFADLNREKRSVYDFPVRAKLLFNNGHKQLEAYSRVVINVLDTDDNCPSSDHSNLNFTIFQNLSSTHSFGGVKFTDADAGRNSKIYYFLNRASNRKYFRIDSHTGDLYATRVLRDIPAAVHSFTVRAVNPGAPITQCHLVSQMSINVNVKASNLHEPQIKVIILNNVLTPGVKNTLYAKVSVTDKDEGSAGLIKSLFISEPLNASSIFYFAPTKVNGEYYLRLRQHMKNISIFTSHQIVLKAIDGGSPALSSTKRLTVNLVTLANYKLNFPSKNVINVPESSLINSTVHLLKPRLLYRLPNMKLIYVQQLSYSEGSLPFKITKFGSVVVTSDLKSVNHKQIVIPFTVKDQNNFHSSGIVYSTLIVNVTHASNVFPAVKNNNTIKFISESTPIGSRVLRISVIDHDSISSQLRYHLFNEELLPFGLDSVDPTWLIVRKKLDAEVMPGQFILFVRISNSDKPFPRTAIATYKIGLTDTDEFPPQFVSEKCRIFISKSAPSGIELGRFDVQDLDVGAAKNVGIKISKVVDGQASDSKCFLLENEALKLNCEFANRDLGNAKDQRVTLHLVADDGEKESEPLPVEVTVVPASDAVLEYQLFQTKCHKSNISQLLEEQAANQSNYSKALNKAQMSSNRQFKSGHSAPVFSPELPSKLHIREDMSLESIILVVRVNDSDDMRYTPSGLLAFGLLESNLDSNSFPFTLNQTSNSQARLVVSSPLDYEIVTQYDFSIRVCDRGLSSMCITHPISVFVSNVNDNPPRFTKGSMDSTSLSEDYRVKSFIMRISAVDDDEPGGSSIRFMLKNHQDTFRLTRKSGRLKLKKDLDRETKDSYNLLIVARDGGNPELSATQIVSIKITDINDNHPIFSLSSYSVLLLEDLPVGTYITTFMASDADEGDNGRVSYFIDGSPEDKSCFTCDADSGVLTLNCKLNFQKRYELKVKAIDNGRPTLFSVVNFTARVQAASYNTFAPKFKDSLLHATILENEPPNTFVVKVLAEDMDKHYPIRYSIEGGSGAGRFQINETGHITSLQSFNAEASSHYWLLVWASDSASLIKRGFCEVFVNIRDVNDENPIPASASYSVIMSENSSPGTELIRVQAYDLDRSQQSLTYSITGGNPQGNFLIHPNTGVISTSSRLLDREKNMGLGQDRTALEIIDLTVSIVDNGNPPKVGTAHVFIRIEDENDNNPEFLKKSPATVKVLLPKNNAGGVTKCVARAFAFDFDAGENGTVTYRLESVDSRNFYPMEFFLNQSSGHICTTRTLQPGSRHTLIVTAQDHGQPAKWSEPLSLTMEVVSPVPVFSRNKAPLSMVSKFTSLTVEENYLPGRLLKEVTVFDPTQSLETQELEYRLTGGPFDVDVSDRSAAYLYLDGYLNASRTSRYTLRLIVTNGDETMMQELTVTVLPYNRYLPQFTKNLYEVTISESVSPGDKILQLNVQSKYLGRKRKFAYSVVGMGDPQSMHKFRIDSRTGELFVSSPLDYETNSIHTLLIDVKDSGRPRRSGYTKVVITVTDHNEHSPQFVHNREPQGAYYSVLLSTTAVGSRLFRVPAFDLDRGANAQLNYKLIEHPASQFSIDKDTGEIFSSESLVPLEGENITLRVVVTDSGNPRNSNRTFVTFRIMSATVDGHLPLPKFNTRELSISIPENLPRESVVVALRDVTEICNCPQFFRLVWEDYLAGRNLFGVTENTGVVLTKVSIDREIVGDYFEVWAEILGLENRRHSTGITRIKIKIHIVDLNDNRPQFPYFEPLKGFIREDASIGAVIRDENGQPLTILAVDPDFGINGTLSYRIESEPAVEHFHVDNSSGVLQVRASLDRESISSYKLSIYSTDLCHTVTCQLTSDYPAIVELTVRDVPDNAPIFKFDSVRMGENGPQVLTSGYSAALLLPTYAGAEVIRIETMELDLNQTVKLSILTGNDAGHFHLEEDTGVLTVVNSRFVTEQNFVLTIGASDGVLASYTNVSIHCRHLSGSSLTVLMPGKEQSLEMEENSPPGMVLTTVKVKENPPAGSYFRFTMLTSTQPYFQIDEFSGVITTTSTALDRERTAELELIVLVNDVDQRFARVKFTVAVLDVNDETPQFINLPYHAVFFINQQDNSNESLFVQAHDNDRGENSTVQYSIRYVRPGRDTSLFSIDTFKGKFSLTRELDSEWEGRKIQVGIEGRDSGRPHQLSSTTEITVEIVSRSAPLFDQRNYETEVREDLTSGEIVQRVTAKSPSGGTLLYTISSGNWDEKFSIDFNTGVIRLYGQLDFESINEYSLQLLVTDTKSQLNSISRLKVKVKDVNDQAPQFLREFYEATVSESYLPGYQLLQVQANDTDSGEGGEIIYSLLDSEEFSIKDTFAISSTTGIITLKSKLDYESQKIYFFFVEAKNPTINSLKSTVFVRITVTDFNDNSPQFPQNEYEASISESSKMGAFVAMVIGRDPDVSDRLTYSILSIDDYAHFKIDKVTGSVTYRPTYRPTRRRSLRVKVVATDGVHSCSTQLRVILLPSNRHRPQFPNPLQNFHVYENVSATSVVGKCLSAVDPDSGKYGVLKYSLISDVARKQFDIDVTSGVLRLVAPLDREIKSKWEFLVLAQDGGGLFDYLEVVVTVLDVNDCAPTFTQSKYDVVLSRYTNIGAAILRVSATDQDLGLNARIRYRLADNSLKSRGLPINLHPDSGDFILNGRIPALNSTEVVSVFAQACDYGTPSLCSDPVGINVYLTVDNLFHLIPRISCHTNAVMESELLNRKVAVCTISESKSGLGQWNLISGFTEEYNQPPLFKIDPLSGVILSTGAIDYEKIARYVLTVEYRVALYPPLIATHELTLTVLNANDCDPTFQSSIYQLSVPENLPSGSKLIQVAATDDDEAGPASVTYAFRDPGPLSIDRESGWISIVDANHFDREKRSEVRGVVIVMDNGGRVSTCEVIFPLMDLNDSPIQWLSNNETLVEVDENLLQPITLHHVRVREEERILPVRFYLAVDNAAGAFSVSKSGEIKLTQPLDAEETDQMEILVLATDGLFTTSNPFRLIVKVRDVNDNSPLCIKSSHTVRVSESVRTGSRLVTVTATDADRDDINSRIKYSMSSGDVSLFAVNVDTGDVMTKGALDREDPVTGGKYLVTVRAQDRDSLFCTINVSVDLEDVNDNAPVFTTLKLSPIPEDAPVGSLVGKVHAEDADIGVNRRVHYSIIGTDTGFSIDRNSGVLMVARPLDREKQALHQLVVRAADSGLPRALSSSATVFVRLLDVNDSPPTFKYRDQSLQVKEDHPVGRVLARVQAFSKDEGQNAVIKYRLVSMREEFSLNETSGDLVLVQPLDYERSKEYYLTVEAKDGGEPPLSSTTVLTIRVIDVNDNSPRFTQERYTFSVVENSPKGTSVGKVSARDKDSESNGQVVYSILSSSDVIKTFRMDPATGELLLLISPDREQEFLYHLTVQAEDSAQSPRYSTANVTVVVEDINDNSPHFDKDRYEFVVQVDRDGNISLPSANKSSMPSRDVEIGRLKMSDIDSQPNAAPFSCNLVSGQRQSYNAKSSISTDECVLYARGQLPLGSQSLTVRVNDNGQTARYNTTNIIVNVVRQSNIPPEIVKVNVTVTYYRLSRPLGDITRIMVKDRTPYDRLEFRLTSEFGDLFSIGLYNGTVRANQHLDTGVYPLQIRLANGSLWSVDTIYVTVIGVTEEMVQAACIVRIDNLLPRLFFMENQDRLVRTRIAYGMKVDASHVYILSVQEAGRQFPSVHTAMSFKSSPFSPGMRGVNVKMDNNSISNGQEAAYSTIVSEIKARARRQASYDSNQRAVDILVAVYDPVNKTFYSTDTLLTKLEDLLPSFEQSFTEKIQVFNTLCKSGSPLCRAGRCKTRTVMKPEEANQIEVHKITYMSPKFDLETFCVCEENYGGPRCSIELNDCAKRPCPSSKVCLPERSNSAAPQWGVEQDVGIRQYRCVCPPMRTGPNCEQTIVRPGSGCQDEKCLQDREWSSLMFSGNSYMNWTLLDPMKDRIEIAFVMRTKQHNGHIMKVRWNSLRQFGLSLSSGRLSCGPYLDPYSRPVDPWVQSHRPINDGQWHTVRVFLTPVMSSKDLFVLHHDKKGPLRPWWVELTVDGLQPQVGKSLWQEGDDNEQGILLGAEFRELESKTGSERYISSSFAGCMKNLYVNDRRLPQQNLYSTSAVQLTHGVQIEYMCAEAFVHGECSANPCLHGGVCKSALVGVNTPGNGSRYNCHCSGPFYGQKCSKYDDPCTIKPCYPGAKCEWKSSSSYSKFRCHCPAGLSGALCEVGRQCRDNPCLNRAECQESSSGPVCLCGRGYRGARCEHDINECLEDQGLCKHRGVCRNMPGTFSCECSLGYTGPTCNQEGLTMINPDSNSLGLTQLHVYIIVGLLAFLFLAALATIMLLVCRYRRPRHHSSNTNSIYDLRRRQSLHDMEKESRIQMLPMDSNGLGHHSRATSHCSLASSSMVRLHGTHHGTVIGPQHPHRNSIMSNSKAMHHQYGSSHYIPFSPPTTPTCSIIRGQAGTPNHLHQFNGGLVHYQGGQPILLGHHMQPYLHGGCGSSITTGSDKLSPSSSIATMTGSIIGMKRPHHSADLTPHSGSLSQNEGLNDIHPAITPHHNTKRRRRNHAAGKPPKPPPRPQSYSIQEGGKSKMIGLKESANLMTRSTEGDTNRNSFASLDASTCADNRPYKRAHRTRKHKDGYHWDMLDLRRGNDNQPHPAAQTIPDVLSTASTMLPANLEDSPLHQTHSDEDVEDIFVEEEFADMDVGVSCVTEMTSFLTPDLTNDNYRRKVIPLADCDEEMDEDTLKRGGQIAKERRKSRSPHSHNEEEEAFDEYKFLPSSSINPYQLHWRPENSSAEASPNFSSMESSPQTLQIRGRAPSSDSSPPIVLNGVTGQHHSSSNSSQSSSTHSSTETQAFVPLGGAAEEVEGEEADDTRTALLHQQ